MTRWDACNRVLAEFNPSRFLEIGVKHGRGSRKIEAHFRLGVDPAPEPASHAYTKFYQQTSDQFFADQKGYLNLHAVLVDGLHHADQAMRDILNSVSHLHPRGTVVVHDCNPQTEAAQRVPREQVIWNGDCWKAIVRLRATRPDLRVYTLDTDEGLGLVTWSRGERLITIPDQLTWEGLVTHRQEWLGLCLP